MIILIKGGDHYRCTKKFEELKKNFNERVDPNKLNYSFFNQKNFTFDAFWRDARSLPFLAERRMIVAKDVLGDRKLLTEVNKLEAVLDDLRKIRNVVIFWERTKTPSPKKKAAPETSKKNLLSILSREKFVYIFEPMNQNELLSWICNGFSKEGVQASSEICSYFLYCTGPNLWLIENEIRKCVCYCKKKQIKELDKNIVSELVYSNAALEIYELVDAIGLKEKNKALKILNQLFFQDQDPLALLGMLSAQFRNLILTKDCEIRQTGETELFRVLKLPPFIVRKIAFQTRHFSMDQLKRIYVSLHNMDKRLKSGANMKPVIQTLYSLLIFCL